MPKPRKSKALRETVTSTAIALVGGKPAIAIKAVVGGYRARQDRRLRMLCAEILRDAAEASELAEKINRAMLVDGDAAGDAFVAAARAAVEAVDPAAVVSIALLARHFFIFGTPARREFRAYLAWFESLDATEYGQLRAAVRLLRSALSRGREPLHTEIVYDSTPATTMTLRLRNGEHLELARGPAAAPIVRGFENVLEARGIPPQSSGGSPRIPRDVVELLAEIISPSD